MAFLPQPPFPKSRGDTVRSTDWNDLIVEVQRLDNDKVNRAGDAINGSLSVSGTMAIGTTPDPALSLRIQTAGADNAPLLALATPNNEDFLSIFGGRRGSQLPFVAWKRGDLRVGTATAANGSGFKELLRVNSSDNAPARLEVDGRVRAGQLTVGPWPASPSGYVFFGSNNLDQTQAGNYALLQGTGSETGRTFVNSPLDIHFRINNRDQLILTTAGLLGAAKGPSGSQLRIAAGRTRGNEWVQYTDSGLYVDIDISDAGFSSAPFCFTSLGGNTSHWVTKGATSIYQPTANSFRVYVQNESAITIATAVSRGWYINWLAIGQ